MPLTIATAVTPATGPTLDSPAIITQLAQSQGSPVPAGSTVVGITIPVIRSDQTALQYHTRNNGTEFRFNTGILSLTLRQEIHLSNGLSPCAQTIWLLHEQKHVRDNERIMSRMDAELRADSQFVAILVNPTAWLPRAQFGATQQTIQARVGAVFTRLTQAAAQALDTRQEYANTDTQVRIRCNASVGAVLRLGMYGQGIDILQSALNNRPPSALPALTVDGVFGLKTQGRVIEFQRAHSLTTDGVVGPLTRAALAIKGAFDISTKELAELSQSGDQFFGIHTSNDGKVMIFAGGVPLKRGNDVVGGIGVSGGMGKQDQAVAEAGAEAFK